MEFDFAQPGSLVSVDDQGRIDYRLRLQKQPGLEKLPVRLRVLLPPGYSAQTGGPADELQTEWTWEGTIDQTTDFQVVLIPDRKTK